MFKEANNNRVAPLTTPNDITPKTQIQSVPRPSFDRTLTVSSDDSQHNKSTTDSSDNNNNQNNNSTDVI